MVAKAKQKTQRLLVSVVTFATDLILLNGSLGRTKGSELNLRTGLFILLSCSAQFSSILIHPLTPLFHEQRESVSHESSHVVKVQDRNQHSADQTYSKGGPWATCGPEATPEWPSQESRD